MQAHGEITKRAVEAYGEHKRTRFVPLDDATQEAIGCLYAGCETLDSQHGRTRQLFHAALEKLKGEFGVNCLRDAPQEKRKTPEQFVDPSTGQPCRNPWLPPVNKRDCRSITKHAPELAKFLQRCATEPATLAIELSGEEAARLERNELLTQYNRARHATNPLAGTDRTLAAEFLQAADPAWVAICRAEAEPHDVYAKLFEPIDGSNTRFGNRTLQGEIVRNDPQLWAIIEAAQARMKALRVARHLKAEIEKRADAIELARQQTALADVRSGVIHTADGRTIFRAA